MPVEEEKLRIGIDTFGMANVFKRRDALNEMLEEESTARWVGEKLECMLPSLIPGYSKRLGVTPELVEQSLYGLLSHKAGGCPGLKDYKRANWILAGNVDLLKLGHPVSTFVKVTRKEWAPMVVVDAHKDISAQGHKGFVLTFISMAGYTATEEFRRFVLSRGLFRYIHQVMFGLPKRAYEGLKLPESYVGMWTWVLLDPGLKWDVFNRADCSSAFKQHNRDLLNSRAKPCLYGYKIKCECCPVGSENCVRATHRGKWVQRECAVCGQPGLFDSRDTFSHVCMDCKRAQDMTRKRQAIRRRNGDGPESETEGGGTLVQPGEGPASSLAGNSDEGGGICGGSEVEHPPVVDHPAAEGGCSQPDSCAAQDAGHRDQDGQVSQA